jgi:predicted acyl esterase
MKAGEIYPLTIHMWSCECFSKGHRLRLDVSGSNFPRFDRNLKDGQSVRLDGKPVSATNTGYHDSEHPSALVLPIVASQGKE